MKIRYTVEFEDLKAFWQHFLLTNAAIRRRRAVSTACFAVVFLLLGTRAYTRSGSVLSGVVFAFICCTFLLLYWRFSLKVSDKRLRKLHPPDENKGVFCEHVLELTESGVVESSAVGQSSTTFAGILRVDETPAHAFVFTGSNMAHIIPRAKVTEGDVAAFIRELKVRLAPRDPGLPRQGGGNVAQASCL